jgi:predicted Zn-dependent protease
VDVERGGKDHRYLSKLVGRVQPLMMNHKRYRKIVIYFAKSGEFDARSFPGGHVVFHDGIFDVAESEAALVGVIAHELAHLDHGHQLRAQKRIQQFQSGFGSASFSPADMMQRMSSMGKDFHPFHPEDEAVADLDGVTWTYQLGYNPLEFQRLFARLTKRNARKPDAAAIDVLPTFLRTHPQNAERAEAIAEKLRELSAASPKTELVVGRENLQRRVPADLPPARFSK